MSASRRRIRALGGLLAVALLIAGTAVTVSGAQGSASDGRIGPDLGLLNNGRHLQPFAGRLVGLGNLPTGGAVTPDGRWYWTVDSGRGINDVRIVSVRSGQVVQTLTVPGASGGIALDAAHSLAYVSGVAGSTDTAQAPTPGTPGAGGDVIHVFRFDPASGQAREDRAIAVPPPASAPIPQNFPPTNRTRISWPDRLSVSPDGSTLLVPLNLADQAAVIDTASGSVRYVKTGNYPYGSAILPDGHTGLVSNETPGTVSVIDLRSATKVADIQVGPQLSHPEAIAVDPRAPRAYVALANSDEVAVIDTHAMALARTLAVGRPEGLGTSPVALTVTPDGRQLLVAEAGADALAAFRLTPSGSGPDSMPAFSLIGRIPTAQYPTDVQAVAPGRLACGFSASVSRPRAHRKARARRRRRHRTHRRAHHRGAHRRVSAHRRSGGRGPVHTRGGARHVRLRLRHVRHHRLRPFGAGGAGSVPGGCAKLLYVSAKGLGTGPNPNGPQPNSPLDTDSAINATQYLPLLNIGSAAIADYPSDAQIQRLSGQADAQLTPTDAQAPPPDTPLRAGGPIKHVFYIVRENRTYDQVLGDLPQGDGDPKLTLFGPQDTPNAHALASRFGLLDHFYANSEASIDGHFWTSAGDVSDYVNKNWFQNYRAGANNPGGRPYDFGVYAVTWPSTGFLFDQAIRQGISFFNYGEAIAGVVPLTDKDRNQAETQLVAQKFAKSDVGPPPPNCYPNDASIGKDAITGQTVFDSVPPLLRAPAGSESRAQCFRARFQSQLLAHDAVPAFNYLVLSNDHTRVLDPSSFTPQAMVADNDKGLGQIVDTISHSSIWSSSAIFVTEDDSQDGADHVDAHRTVGLVISPYAKQAQVVHTRYDLLSMLHSMELIIGMRPLGLFDTLATPMYDAFSGSPTNGQPYSALTPSQDLLAKNPPAASPAAARALRFRGLDQISQRFSDRLLWRAIHGAHSAPPPPGPNAVIEPRVGRGAGFDG